MKSRTTLGLEITTEGLTRKKYGRIHWGVDDMYIMIESGMYTKGLNIYYV